MAVTAVCSKAGSELYTVIAYSESTTRVPADGVWHEVPVQYTNTTGQTMYITQVEFGFNCDGGFAAGRLSHRAGAFENVMGYPEMDAPQTCRQDYAPNYITLVPGDHLDFALIGFGSFNKTVIAWVHVRYVTQQPL